MRYRLIPFAGLGAVALLASAVTAPVANAGGATLSPVHHSGHVTQVKLPKPKSGYSQLTTDTTNGVSSQNFETDFDAYDDQAADDFPMKKKCKVTKISWIGQYSGFPTAVADSFHITIYKWTKSRVRQVLVDQDQLTYSQPVTNPGTFVTTNLSPFTLGKGMYWISIVANMSIDPNGQWFWEIIDPIHFDPAMWQNPGGGFTVCPKWADMGKCLGISPDDLAFQIN